MNQVACATWFIVATQSRYGLSSFRGLVRQIAYVYGQAGRRHLVCGIRLRRILGGATRAEVGEAGVDQVEG